MLDGAFVLIAARTEKQLRLGVHPFVGSSAGFPQAVCRRPDFADDVKVLCARAPSLLPDHTPSINVAAVLFDDDCVVLRRDAPLSAAPSVMWFVWFIV